MRLNQTTKDDSAIKMLKEYYVNYLDLYDDINTYYRSPAGAQKGYNEVSGPSAGSGSSSSEVGAVPPGARL